MDLVRFPDATMIRDERGAGLLVTPHCASLLSWRDARPPSAPATDPQEKLVAVSFDALDEEERPVT